MKFDVSLVSRMSDEIEQSGKRMREMVNSPYELQMELQKLESSLQSLKSLTENQSQAGSNANTTQTYPNQNQS
ncbi:hypothetical protein SAMN05192534_1385 [Alteribacillus persepolensis]|uniref:Uncharacterized protein n=1 Tax=Alteribacillus persepolensis TaxID=568899 RepID=A0A1G8JW13_9BACI|nr:hypothetical protein [Alteribacillus persepolensis]SDI35406.1 hypothetical protein SAMN05192534_1385 [Alteribacillus persepolensis]